MLQSFVIIGSAEAVEHTAKEIRLTICANHLGHILRSNHHAVEHVIITIQANLIAFNNLCVVNILRHITFLQRRVVEHESDIRIANLSFTKLTFKEVSHHGYRLIECKVDTALCLITITIPETLICIDYLTVITHLTTVQVLGKLVPFEIWNRVHDGSISQTTQTLVLNRTVQRRQHFQHISATQHRTIKKQLLLARRELIIISYRIAISVLKDRIGLKELLVRVVISDKKRSATCTRQVLTLIEIINQSNDRIEITPTL
ncbi:hypothetical protein EVA_02219 [gut metagenome]|uniref:Uncharacterized protein n=1 Tax=gut metagenome TaxID=749906 RepID=J9D9Z1_9ZZZZ